MRVVFATHAYHPSIGGAERYAQGLAEGLAGLGHGVSVVVPAVEDPQAFYELGHRPVGIPAETIRDVDVERLPYSGPAYKAGRLIGKARALRVATSRYQSRLGDRLEAIAPDVVITLPHLFPNVEEVMRLRTRAAWKLVYAPMLHEHDPYWSVERVAGAVAVADGVMALTTHERSRLVEAYRANAATTVLVPPGVEASSVIKSDRDQVVLFVGRRMESKRLDVLYEAMKVVWIDFADVRLVIAGSPPLFGKDPAGPMAVDERVDIVESPTEQAKADLLGSALVVVNPSLTESFGMTTLEAWAHGTPVVVVDTPVNRSVVTHERDGLIAPPTSQGIAAALVRLLADPGLVATLGMAGHHRSENQYSWAASTRNLDGLLRRLRVLD